MSCPSRGRRLATPPRLGTPHGLESFDRHFSDLLNGAPQPSPSPRLAEHEEESPYYGVDEDDEDDDEDEENPVVFRATATVALGAWFAYTRKKKADEERRPRQGPRRTRGRPNRNSRPIP